MRGECHVVLKITSLNRRLPATGLPITIIAKTIRVMSCVVSFEKSKTPAGAGGSLRGQTVLCQWHN